MGASLRLIEEPRGIEYPKDPVANLAWRKKLLAKASDDLVFREKLRRLFFEDIVFAFNAFFYTLDVRKRPNHHLPFCTYPFQDDVLKKLNWAIEAGKDLVVEKSRDMGASWMVILTFLHHWLNPIGGSDFLLGSRIEDYVDRKGDMRTLFEKLRYGLYRLPKWLRPQNFSPKKHDNYMKLQNPETGSTIGGESNNPNFSTGGRYAGVLFDEFAKWDVADESAWRAAGDATPCRIAISTPNGTGNQFYALVTDGRTERIRLHWSLHPEKGKALSCVWPPPNENEKVSFGGGWKPLEKLTSPWYALECLRRQSLEIAQELDIDYLGSGNPVFDGKAWATLVAFHGLEDKPKNLWSIDLNTEELVRGGTGILDWDGFLVEYEEPSPGFSYALGVDVCEGKEQGDFSSIIVLNRVTKNVAAVYWSRIDEAGLGRVVMAISKRFTTKWEPWVGIETIGPGIATFDYCAERGLGTLFMAPRYDTVNGGVSFLKGFRTSQSSRNELVAGIKEYLISEEGFLNSQRLVGELMTFVKTKTGKPAAKEGCFDDMVMALGIAIQVDALSPAEHLIEERKGLVLEPDDVRRPRLEDLRTGEDTSIEARCLEVALSKKSLDYAYDELEWGWDYAEGF